MTPRKVILDTNLYIGWLNEGHHEDLMLGMEHIRYMSTVVQMELRVGARTLAARRTLDKLVRSYRDASRMVTPNVEIFDEAGRALRRLRDQGREIRRASLVHDVLIALSARSIGATVLTMDGDFEAISRATAFRWEMVAR